MPGLNIPHRKVILPNKQSPSEGLLQRIEKILQGAFIGKRRAQLIRTELDKTIAEIKEISKADECYFTAKVLKALDSNPLKKGSNPKTDKE